jgi:hypothetical protein
MAPPIHTTEPASLIAGDTAKWLKTLADYPASEGWALTYTLVNAAQRITFSAGAQGDDHLVNVSAATTASWTAGDYSLRASVSKSGEVYTTGTGRITIAPAFGTAQDARSQARRMLEAVNATLEGRATSATAEYEIAGRKIKYIPMPELLTLRDRLRRDVAAEDAASDAAAGMPGKGRIYVRFGP